MKPEDYKIWQEGFDDEEETEPANPSCILTLMALILMLFMVLVTSLAVVYMIWG